MHSGCESTPAVTEQSWFHPVDLEGQVQRAARSDVPVLVSGEPGVGKTFIAQLIHDRSSYRHAPCARIHCAADVSELVMPHGTTVVLDDVPRLSATLQADLVQFLERRAAGDSAEGGAWRNPDVRIVSTMTVAGGIERRPRELTERLFYRLNAIHVAVPPLRDHVWDIPRVVDHWVAESERQHCRIPAFSSGALDELMAHRWPGNVGELRTVVDSFAGWPSACISETDVRLALTGTGASLVSHAPVQYHSRRPATNRT